MWIHHVLWQYQVTEVLFWWWTHDFIALLGLLMSSIITIIIITIIIITVIIITIIITGKARVMFGYW